MKPESTKRTLKLLTLLILPLFALYACEDSASPPTVTTAEVSEITTMEAMSGGHVTADGGDAVIERGIVWDTSPNPSLETNTGNRSSGSGIGEFSSAMTGLSPGLNYHVRAYATNSEGTSYGDNLTFTTDEAELEFLLPGNWDDAETLANYVWGEGEGYIFGTNIFDDKAYGQLFNTTQNYEIYGAIFWIATRRGATGNIDFKIWNYVGGQVGQVLGSKSVPVSDITPALELDNALYVEFDPPIVTSGSFLIGADFTGMGAYSEGVNELANVSTGIGDGLGANLALVLESNDQWVSVGAAYDVDVDIAIFPYAMPVGKSGGLKSSVRPEKPALPAHPPFIHMDSGSAIKR